MKVKFSRQIFEKNSNTKFHQNTSSGIRVVPYERADRQMDMTKLLVAFRNFAKAPKIQDAYNTVYYAVCWITDLQTVGLLRDNGFTDLREVTGRTY